MLSDTKMTRMMGHINLGGSLEGARRANLVETPEEEEMYLDLEKEIREIKAKGMGIADVGLASWTED